MLQAFTFAIPFETAFLSLWNGAASATRFLGMLLVAVWVISLLTGASRLPRQRPLLWALAFMAWCALSGIWAIQRDNLFQDLITAGQLLILAAATVSVTDSPHRMRRLLATIFVSSALVAIMGLLGIGASTGKSGQLALTGQGIKEYGFYVGLAFLMAVTVAVLYRGRYRWAAFCAAAVCGLTLLATAERGVLVALFLAWLATAALTRHRGPAIAFALAFVVLGAVALNVLTVVGWLPERVKERMSVSDLVESGGTGRDDIWKVGLAMFADHPVLGTGLKNFRAAAWQYSRQVHTRTSVSQGRDPHADWLEVLAGLGLVGFALFALFLGSAMRDHIRVIRGMERLPQLSRVLAVMVWAILLYVFCCGLTSTFMWRKIYWLAFALSVAVPVVVGSPRTHPLPAPSRSRALRRPGWRRHPTRSGSPRADSRPSGSPTPQP